MRTTQCVRARWLLGAIGACMLVAGAARADVTTERPGSILIFPKVVNDGTRDTVIQVTNTSNSLDTAECFYLDGEKGRSGQALCSETDFVITLTKQQPTVWLASTGRPVTVSDGLSPGIIPAVPVGFTGALVCAEVDQSLSPLAMNAIKGEASLIGPGLDISKYNGITAQGGTSGQNNEDNVLDLDGREYNACPASTRVNFIGPNQIAPVIPNLGNGGLCAVGGAPCTTSVDCAEGPCLGLACSPTSGNPGALCTADSDCTNGGSCNVPLASVTTNVTVLPCNLNFNTLTPTTVAITLDGANGFEQSLSGSRTFSCWDNFNITPTLLTGLFTEFNTVSLSAGAGGPFLAVVQTFHSDSLGNTASAATNTHVEGQCIPSCVITDGGVNTFAPCLSNADCTSGSQTCPAAATATNIGDSCASNAECGANEVCSGPRFCSGGSSAGTACIDDSTCTGGKCPLPTARITLPGA